jgi:hypothetical protein
MNNPLDSRIGRRDVLRTMGIAGIAAAGTTAKALPALAETVTEAEKLKARYQANSPEVQTFYRVNRYPKK